MTPETAVQVAKLVGSAAIFSCAIVELWPRGRLGRQTRVIGLCIMTFCGGFLAMALL